MSQLFVPGDQNIGASASAPFLPRNIQGWFPLGLTGLISLPSKGLSKVFSNTKVQRYQFFGVLPSLWSTSHIHTRLLKNHSFDYTDIFWQSNVSAFHLCIISCQLLVESLKFLTKICLTMNYKNNIKNNVGFFLENNFGSNLTHRFL